MFISVVIPTLNEEDYLGILLSSLVSQTHKDFEVIVVDGGSTDVTEKEAEKFKNRLQLQFVKSPQKGIAFQRNYGANIAQAEHLMFMDADCFIESTFIEKIADFISTNPEIDVLTTWMKLLSGKKRDRVLAYIYNQLVLDFAKTWSPIAHGAFICIKKKVFSDLEGFRSLLVGEDYDLVGRAHKRGYHYGLLKYPQIQTSVRRLEKMGRPRYLLAMGKNAIYYQFRDLLKNAKWLDYKLDEGGAYYKGVEKTKTVEKLT